VTTVYRRKFKTHTAAVARKYRSLPHSPLPCVTNTNRLPTLLSPRGADTGDTRSSVPIKYNNIITTVVYVKRCCRKKYCCRPLRPNARSAHAHAREHTHSRAPAPRLYIRAQTRARKLVWLGTAGHPPPPQPPPRLHTRARARAQPARMGRRRIKLISSHTCSRFPPCPMSIQCLRSSGSVRFVWYHITPVRTPRARVRGAVVARKIHRRLCVFSNNNNNNNTGTRLYVSFF